MMITEKTRDYILLLLVCFFAFFVNNQVIPADLMESRNIATAQEMVREGNYLIPTMNGEYRLEKPPLPTWISALIEHISPGQLILHRYAAGIAGTVMVFFLYFLMFEMTRRRNTALVAGMVLASCFSVVMMGRTATWDIYCHSFMLGAIYFIYKGFTLKGYRWGYFISGGIFMGLSFLSKGPVSFYALLLPFLIALFVIIRPELKSKFWPVITMVLICVVISSWWTTYLLIFEKEAAMAVARKESSSWINHNVRPWYYYWQFPAEAGIWALFWVTSLFWFYWKKGMANKKAYLFSILWTFAGLILLSVIPEKKTRYLLPLLIPGAINVAFYIEYCSKQLMNRMERGIFKINATVIALITFLVPIALYLVFFRQSLISTGLLSLISIISVGIGAGILYNTYKRRIRVAYVFLCIVGIMVMVESFCLIPAGKLMINKDRHSIRAMREMEEFKNIPFYYNQEEDLRIEFVYESNRTIRPLDLTDDSLLIRSQPFLLLSSQPADEILNDSVFHIRHIDTYDNNWQPRHKRRYNPNLVRSVSVVTVRPEKQNNQDDGI